MSYPFLLSILKLASTQYVQEKPVMLPVLFTGLFFVSAYLSLV
jgi:hypothetical protein